MNIFGGPFQIIDDTELPADARSSPVDYAAWVKHQLANLQPRDQGVLRFRRPRPTAAFSPQDTTHPNYERIRQHARVNGFEPIERGTGGRLTMFDEHALAITIISPHVDPHQHMSMAETNCARWRRKSVPVWLIKKGGYALGLVCTV